MPATVLTAPRYFFVTSLSTISGDAPEVHLHHDRRKVEFGNWSTAAWY